MFMGKRKKSKRGNKQARKTVKVKLRHCDVCKGTIIYLPKRKVAFCSLCGKEFKVR